MNKFNKINFAFIAFLIAFTTAVALLLALIIVYPWNWLNGVFHWELSLKYWPCAWCIGIITFIGICWSVFRSSNTSNGISDQQVDDYINQQVGPGYWDNDDPYGDY